MAHPRIRDFITGLRNVASSSPGGIITPVRPHLVINDVIPLAKTLAAQQNEWVKPKYLDYDSEKGCQAHVLHHEPDGSLAVLVFSWMPGKSIPPHNHGSWAVVVGLRGDEKNVLYERVAPDATVVRKVQEVIVRPNEHISFLPDAIHSVENASPETGLSLHIYGWHRGRPEFWIYPPGYLRPTGLPTLDSHQRITGQSFQVEGTGSAPASQPAAGIRLQSIPEGVTFPPLCTSTNPPSIV